MTLTLYYIQLTSRVVRDRLYRRYGHDSILGYLAGVPKLVYQPISLSSPPPCSRDVPNKGGETQGPGPQKFPTAKSMIVILKNTLSLLPAAGEIFLRFCTPETRFLKGFRAFLNPKYQIFPGRLRRPADVILRCT